MKTDPQGYVVVDTETTGFHPKWGAEIIKIHALGSARNGRPQRFVTYVRPKRKLSRIVSGVIGISQNELHRKGKPLREALEGFFRFVKHRRIVVFNADFEGPFWKAAARQCGLPMPARMTCALRTAKRAWPGMKSYGLRNLASSVPAVKRRALRRRSDCALVAAVYEAAVAKLRVSR